MKILKNTDYAYIHGNPNPEEMNMAIFSVILSKTLTPERLSPQGYNCHSPQASFDFAVSKQDAAAGNKDAAVPVNKLNFCSEQ